MYDEYTALNSPTSACAVAFDTLAAQLGPDETAIRTVPGLDPDGLHRLAARLSEATTGLCAALTPSEKGTGYCIAQAGGDVRTLTKALNAALNGRGGGKPGICQQLRRHAGAGGGIFEERSVSTNFSRHKENTIL